MLRCFREKVVVAGLLYGPAKVVVVRVRADVDLAFRVKILDSRRS